MFSVQRVQTLQTGDSGFQSHTHTLQCEMSLQYCYIHFSFRFICLELCSTNVPSDQKHFLVCPGSPSLLCALKHVGSFSLASHASACCPECPDFPSPVWSCCTISKVPFNHCWHQYLKHSENTNKRESNYRYLWPWDAVSLCWRVVAASNYSISSWSPCDPRLLRVWSLVSSQQSGEHSQAILSINFNLPCALFDRQSALRFSSSCGGFARRGTCYTLSAASPPNALWAV